MTQKEAIKGRKEMRYIDGEKLKSHIKSLQCEQGFDTGEAERAYQIALKDILASIDSLQQERPEYGYLSTTYIPGKKARWNVGDTLAYYLCTSNEEGETIIGKITKVEFSDEEGWVYTFEDESMWDEQSLAEEGVYKITKNGK